MALNIKEDAFVEQFAFEGAENSKPAGIATSQNITGIEVRLSRAFIINNKTPKIGPFPGFSKMYLMLIVVSDTGDALQNLELKGFAKVGDNEDLPVDKTIYFWKQQQVTDKSPSQIHVLASILKSKQNLRDVAKVMSDVKNDPEFASVVSTLKEVVKNASAVTQISDLLFSVAGVFGKFLGKVDDKPILTWVQSFTDINGDFDKLGKTTIGRKNDFAALDLSIIIRDTHREIEFAALQNAVIEELEIAKNGEIS
ncbi:hypothetical protein [Adhaeribacter pallidiroseus]|uniref:Uncharacterized protein n=1 Tax=Adhaeribacter pallidiroseus TaxID=2072847 RepID=A0A369QCP5_9BACT|nr:hypothetical protein [Adhaeribacter pallidiroseus]RDC62464.1 hypothetical protein AHMF7616_01058 [Adhaeribacter pallidiroseus]